MFQIISSAITEIVIRKPIVVLVSMLALVAASSVYIANLNIDASPDSLMLESDPDLKYYREVHREYGTDEYIIVGFKPNKAMLELETIRYIEDISNQFKKINGIAGVTSLSNVPLLLQLKEDEKTGETSFSNLLNSNVDLKKAEQEFTSSPIYVNNLISKDLSTTAIKVDIQKNKELVGLIEHKYELLEQQESDPKKTQITNELEELRDNIILERQVINQRYKEVLDSVRGILAAEVDKGEFYLAGAPLIGNDMKEYVVKDIRTFGIAILGIMIVVLFLFFRKPAWIFLALICAVLNVLLVAGLASLLGFQLTIISSNFVALLIIFSVTLSIHVIIRYQEIQAKHPDDSVEDKIRTAISQIITPCSYMVLTSAIAFFSLVVSDINPVITFGYIMILGLFCAFLLTFTVLPALIKLIKPISRKLEKDKSADFLENILQVIVKNKKLTLTILIGMFALNILGISQLTVENRFIDYFKKSTDIYKGLELVDQDLGGTVPLEIMLEAGSEQEEIDDELEEDEEFGDYLTELEETQDDFTAKSYWYNRSGIKKINKVHRYLEDLPQIGKVLSLSSTEEVFRTINKGGPLEDFHLSLVYSKVPEKIKNVLISPYVSSDGSQARVLARIKDSDHTLIRNDLLKKIKADLNGEFIKNGESVRLTGISVLYNNVLQSLFKSQILTLGTVFVAILIMLIVLFRSVKLAIIGTLPNIFTALFILGCMGVFGIPLDIMTITIAAITIGIGVDYAIHYIHRYKKEYAESGDNYQAIHKSQTTVGKALYFTSITITLGFVVLILSNFVPSIYFGLLTSVAMLVSLFATFSIIPLLLSVMKPLKV
ncbi:MAG: MMPL family transporter [Gammaproteobacteria bacterium]|nr:MAG: MMPL family transporter [Gammaproteobacteria bacterium]